MEFLNKKYSFNSKCVKYLQTIGIPFFQQSVIDKYYVLLWLFREFVQGFLGYNQLFGKTNRFPYVS